MPETVDPQKPRTDKAFEAIKLVTAIYLGLFIPTVYFVTQHYLKKLDQRKAELAEKRRQADERMASIRRLKTESKELPACPLIFPLLNEKGKVTPTGSYLSFLAMKQATYLPEPVLRLPNAGELFQTFKLFSKDPGVDNLRVYRKELPFRFMAKDFVEGTWKRKGKDYRVSLHFWGSKPEKDLSKVFKKKDLYLAPVWIAQKTHEWIGTKLTEPQTAFLKDPIYRSTDDFLKGARLEEILWVCPAIALGMDKLLATNPDRSFLFDCWLAVMGTKSNNYEFHVLEPKFQKSPKDYFYRAAYEDALDSQQKYQEAFDLRFADLLGDNNNSMVYGKAIGDLEKLGYYPEAIELNTIWTELHPDDQEAWMRLANLYKAYAWKARGTEFANKVTQEGWRLMKERMAKAVEYADKAASIAPEDCRVWVTEMAMGNGANFDKKKMYGFFDKVRTLNPYREEAYNVLWEYLQPKWNGELGESLEFARKYKGHFPRLIYKEGNREFFIDPKPKTDAELQAWEKKVAEKTRKSPILKEFQESMEAYLKDNYLDTTYWSWYIFYMDRVDAGQRDRILKFAREVIPDDPELKGLYPMICHGTVMAAEWAIHTDAEKDAYERRPDVVKLDGDALRELVRVDPDNYIWLGLLAMFDFKAGDLEGADKCYDALGQHWDGGFHDMKDLENHRKQVKDLLARKTKAVGSPN